MTEMTWVAGVDEAGRGPLAGPVMAAAVILDPARPIAGLADSKRLTPRARRHLSAIIQAQAWAWAVARAEVEEIERWNILGATLLAMSRAVQGLGRRPDLVLVDGNRCPSLDCPVQALVGGDISTPAISAASILAKVARDQEMEHLDQLHPGYGFAAHKGYPTAAHLQALDLLGVSDVHRRGFAPVRRVLERRPVSPE